MAFTYQDRDPRGDCSSWPMVGVLSERMRSGWVRLVCPRVYWSLELASSQRRCHHTGLFTALWDWKVFTLKGENVCASPLVPLAHLPQWMAQKGFCLGPGNLHTRRAKMVRMRRDFAKESNECFMPLYPVFFFFWLHHEACKILVPLPGPRHWKHQVLLTTELPGIPIPVF